MQHSGTLKLFEMSNYPRLIISITDFEIKVRDLQAKGETFSQKYISTEDGLTELLSDLTKWNLEVLEVLQSSFEIMNNDFVKEFKSEGLY